jgi:hypothetical protein
MNCKDQSNKHSEIRLVIAGAVFKKELFSGREEERGKINNKI